jgi:hypothetical protein
MARVYLNIKYITSQQKREMRFCALANKPKEKFIGTLFSNSFFGFYVCEAVKC